MTAKKIKNKDVFQAGISVLDGIWPPKAAGNPRISQPKGMASTPPGFHMGAAAMGNGRAVMAKALIRPVPLGQASLNPGGAAGLWTGVNAWTRKATDGAALQAENDPYRAKLGWAVTPHTDGTATANEGISGPVRIVRPQSAMDALPTIVKKSPRPEGVSRTEEHRQSIIREYDQLKAARDAFIASDPNTRTADEYRKAYRQDQENLARMKELDAEYDRLYVGTGLGGRIWNGVQSFGKTLVGSVPALVETGWQAAENAEADKGNPRLALLQAQERAFLQAAQQMLDAGLTDTKAYADLTLQLQEAGRQIEAEKNHTTVDRNAFGQTQLREAREKAAKATDDIDSSRRFINGVVMGAANSAALLPAAAVSPAIPVTIMSVQAAAQKTAELNEQGRDPLYALERGAASGLIEAGTESLFDLVKVDGKDAARSVLKQAGVEAGEEGAGYLANFLTDYAVHDPDAQFSLQELEEQLAAGALSGAMFEAGGTILKRTGIGNVQADEMNAVFTDQNNRLPHNTAADAESQAMGGLSDILNPAGVGVEALDRARAARNMPRPYGMEALEYTGQGVLPPDAVALRRYQEQIDGVFTGALGKGKAVDAGATPEILQQYGANSPRMTLSQATARKIAYPEGYFGGKHNLGISALKQLPQQLSSPEAILKPQTQRDSLVILTQWIDTHGDPVIVPVHLNKNGTVEVENQIASAYGKGRLQALLGENGSNILYIKNNESISRRLSHGLQLPEATTDDALVVYRIAHPAQKLNSQAAQPQPFGMQRLTDGLTAPAGPDMPKPRGMDALQPRRRYLDNLIQKLYLDGKKDHVSEAEVAETPAGSRVRDMLEEISQGSDGSPRDQTLTEFLEEAARENKETVRFGRGIYAYTRTPDAQVSETARQVSSILRERYGIEAVIFNNDMVLNDSKSTVQYPMEAAATAPDGRVFVINGIDMDPAEVAGHEKLHYIAKKFAEDYHEFNDNTFQNNINYRSKQLQETLETIVAAYCEKDYDLSDLRQSAKIFEELAAYISGWRDQDYDAYVLKCGAWFHDFNAIEEGFRRLDSVLANRQKLNSEPFNTGVHVDKILPLGISWPRGLDVQKPRQTETPQPSGRNIIQNESINQLLSSRLQLPSATTDNALVFYRIAHPAQKRNSQAAQPQPFGMQRLTDGLTAPAGPGMPKPRGMDALQPRH